MPRLVHLQSFLPVLVGLVLTAGPVAAQEQERVYETPAHISFVEGTAVLERDGAVEQSPRSMPLLAGDRVRTEAGRVEVLFADGSTLHLDAHTTVDFQSDEVVRLLEGRVRLNIPGPDRAIAYRIDAPGAWVEVRAPGEYRVGLGGATRSDVELAVIRGAADLVNDQGATELRAGERAYAAASLAPSQPYVFNSAAWDAFDRWSESRRGDRLGVSAQYLPAEVRPYAASLDYYGSWRHEPTYGYVWYPRVAPGWRPYYYGRWSHLRPFGWTWIGHDPWAWPTHHYGRWGFSAGVWFWIPGRHWGPAWVSWGYAPGYVSWCPLGFNNRPVFSFVSFNVFGGRRFTPWHGWTVVPHRRFGHGFVNVNVVSVTRIDARTRSAFSARSEAPAFTGRAVQRAQAPIRAAGSRVTGYAVPRGSSPSISSPSADTRSRQAIRRRSGTGDGLTGPGYPAPARQPNPSAADAPSRGRATGTAAPRAAQPGSPDPSSSGRRAAPRTSSPAATPGPAGSTPSRRAVPRGDDGSAPAAVPAPQGSSPSPRATPRRGSGSAPAATPPPQGSSPSPRATPRRGGGSAPAATPAPQGSSPSPRATPRRGSESAPVATPAPQGSSPSRRAAPRGGSTTAPARESRAGVAAVPRASRPAPSGAPAASAPRSARPTRGPAPVMTAPPPRTPSASRPADRSGSPGRAAPRSSPRPEFRSPPEAPRSAPRGAAAPTPRGSRAPSSARPAPSSGSQPSARPAPSSGGSGGGSSSRPRSRPRGGGGSGTP